MRRGTSAVDEHTGDNVAAPAKDSSDADERADENDDASLADDHVEQSRSWTASGPADTKAQQRNETHSAEEQPPE